MQINLINGEGAEHDIVVEQYAVRSDRVVGKARAARCRSPPTGPASSSISAPCRAIVNRGCRAASKCWPGTAAAATDGGRSFAIRRSAAPDARASQVVRVDLETVELVGQLDDKTIQLLDLQRQGARPIPARARRRYRRGAPQKSQDSVMVHSVDFHAATGPGGGASSPRPIPGKETVVTFKALVPGIFIYHCATPSVPNHITNGMYGLVSCRAGRRAATGRPRILRHAGRALHGAAVRYAG